MSLIPQSEKFLVPVNALLRVTAEKRKRGQLLALERGALYLAARRHYALYETSFMRENAFQTPLTFEEYLAQPQEDGSVFDLDGDSNRCDLENIIRWYVYRLGLGRVDETTGELFLSPEGQGIMKLPAYHLVDLIKYLPTQEAALWMFAQSAVHPNRTAFNQWLTGWKAEQDAIRRAAGVVDFGSPRGRKAAFKGTASRVIEGWEPSLGTVPLQEMMAEIAIPEELYGQAFEMTVTFKVINQGKDYVAS